MSLAPISLVKNHPFRSLVVLGASLAMLAAYPISAAAPNGVPDLPPELKKKSVANKLLLVDFYAEWCSTCKRMSPHVNRIVGKLSNKVAMTQVDVEKPENTSLAQRYNIQGTPTYVVFDANGKAIFMMNRYISSLVLEDSLKALTGSRPAKALPAPLNQKTAASPWTLVAVHGPACKSCEGARSDLNALGKQRMSKPIDVVTVNLPLQPKTTADHEAMQIAKALSVKTVPTYVLLDRQSREFFRSTDPYQANQMASTIELFMRFNLSVH